mmetsp:Transcript_46209/g.134536  ORF Transcript_46209/g.134536 Transcript_46209/m.134536 type:complete len:233 (+) Transcript_46209:957-1655(+)
MPAQCQAPPMARHRPGAWRRALRQPFHLTPAQARPPRRSPTRRARQTGPLQPLQPLHRLHGCAPLTRTAPAPPSHRQKHKPLQTASGRFHASPFRKGKLTGPPLSLYPKSRPHVLVPLTRGLLLSQGLGLWACLKALSREVSHARPAPLRGITQQALLKLGAWPRRWGQRAPQPPLPRTRMLPQQPLLAPSNKMPAPHPPPSMAGHRPVAARRVALARWRRRRPHLPLPPDG